MKKIIVTSTLKFIPKNFQDKALCKGLNYIFSTIDMADFENITMKLYIGDINKSWVVIHNGKHFTSTKKHKVNLEIAMPLNTAFNLKNKLLILEAIQQGNIEFMGELALVNKMKEIILQLDEKRLAYLSKNLLSFSKVKPPLPSNGFDFNNIKLSDLKHPEDINLIRDEAVRLEKLDLQKALSLMTLAHQARPNGQFIARKMVEYQKKLMG